MVITAKSMQKLYACINLKNKDVFINVSNKINLFFSVIRIKKPSFIKLGFPYDFYLVKIS